ncbi:hypothetical protein [Flavobacterium sp.]|jgi:hypothetical protein|uniref:hypothetical protein n=1 Tax=Flavobacterium sp. TaxID=239 RepID=UPI002A837E0F|nr:hypothetical protein [Flavobacterium sp.]
MKNIKYLFLVLFLSFSVAQAQQYRFKTTGFMVTEKTKFGVWSVWSKFQKSEMIVVLDADKDRIVVYSEALQLFNIVKYYDKKETKEGNVVSFLCVDNTGLECDISIFTRKDKNNLKQLYIYYDNRVVAYNMNLLSDKPKKNKKGAK